MHPKAYLPLATDLSNSSTSSFNPGIGGSEDPQLLFQGSSTWLPETDKPYMCSSCGKGYTHIFTLNRHRRTVCGKPRNTSGKWKCVRCTKSYVTEGNLVRHLKYECGVKRMFYCIFCKRKFFTQRSSLTRHLRHFHNESFESNARAIPGDHLPINPCHADVKSAEDSKFDVAGR